LNNPESILDRIIVRNLLVRGILGINPDERTSRQDILINLEIFTDIRTAACTDSIDDSLNYRSLTKAVIEHVEAAEDLLVERLVTEVADLILHDFRALAVRVRIEKPGALRFAESVGIEIYRTAPTSLATVSHRGSRDDESVRETGSPAGQCNAGVADGSSKSSERGRPHIADDLASQQKRGEGCGPDS
jgi:FolB domain-containing protein